jgi:hypothetical protein
MWDPMETTYIPPILLACYLGSFHTNNLGSMLLGTTCVDIPFYFYSVFECEYLRNGNLVSLFMLLRKCDRICDTLQIDFSWSSPNVISYAYAIVKSSQNELSNCCITFASEYSKKMKPCK